MAEQPFRSRQVRGVAAPDRECLLCCFDPRAKDGGGRGRERHDHVLQIVAAEEHAVEARRRNQVEGVRVALVERHAGLEALQEKPLAVVADVRNDEQRDVGASHDGVGARADTDRQRDLEIADGDAVRRGRLARGLRGCCLRTGRSGNRQERKSLAKNGVHGADRRAGAPGATRCGHCFRACAPVLFAVGSELLRKCTPGDLSVMNPAPLCVHPHTLYKVATDSARHAA